MTTSVKKWHCDGSQCHLIVIPLRIRANSKTRMAFAGKIRRIHNKYLFRIRHIQYAVQVKPSGIPGPVLQKYVATQIKAFIGGIAVYTIAVVGRKGDDLSLSRSEIPAQIIQCAAVVAAEAALEQCLGR